ncbi:F-box domain containing protein, partial [Tanacetum coccineum]
FNNFVVGSSKLYGLEKYVTYANLSRSNFCFSTTLNKTTEPTTYDEAIRNPKWIESMNNEIEALLRNNTWTICDLPKGRKPVGSKWLWKIKFKSTGTIEEGISLEDVAKGYSLEGRCFDYSGPLVLLFKMSLLDGSQGKWNASLTVTLVEMALCKIDAFIALRYLKKLPQGSGIQINRSYAESSNIEHGLICDCESGFDYIPFEIQSDIIKRLRVKSLAQFRSVSKQWKSFIDNPKFIKNYHTNPKHHLLVRYNHVPTYTSIIDDNTFPGQKFPITAPEPLNLLKFTFTLGSVDGLLGFCGLYKDEDLETMMVFLWNPSVRKCVGIVIPNAVDLQFGYTRIGFGVCSNTSDPKLVKINVVETP